MGGGDAMGFSYRKSVKIGPFRVTASKSGISYSVGVNGARVTKRANGKVQTTLSAPGPGLRYTTTSGSKTGQAKRPAASNPPPARHPAPTTTPPRTDETPASKVCAPGRADYEGGRPAWMRNGAQAVLLTGQEDLEVVGESHYQENLWELVGGRRSVEQRVRKEILALLVVEDNNPYDPAAVAVWIDGCKVGHLSRADARWYRPGLLALDQAHGRPIALTGVIVGGGLREDGPGRLGVFLRHDPADFDRHGKHRRPPV